METQLYLIPSPLGDSSDLMNEIYKILPDKIKIDHFFVESRKLPIQVIKAIEGDALDEKISILNKNTSLDEIDEYLAQINNKTAAVITDAGIPGISDPGTVLIRKSHMLNYNIRPLITASSITAALAASGLRGESFTYHGYLDKEKDKRIEQIKAIEETSKNTGASQIFIETPYRNKHVWKDILNFCSPSTDFSISVDLFKKDQFIKTACISNWKRMKWPELTDNQAVFLINAKPMVS